MKKRKTITTSTILLLMYCGTFAQDIHFSQYYMAPVNLNPALAGNFNGNQRLAVNYKNQWQSFGAPYRTYAMSFDAGILKKKWDAAYLGIGVSAFSDKAGDTQFGTSAINLSISGIVKIADNQNLSAGMQGGYTQKSITGTELHWGNQYDGTGYNPTIPGETNSFATSSYGDFSTGLVYNYARDPSTLSSNDNFLVNSGVSFWHINKPAQEFYLSSQKDLYRKLIFHTQVHYGIPNSVLALRPSLFLALQGNTREIVLGSWVRYMLRENSKYTGLMKEMALSAGAFYRNGDALIPGILFEYANYAIGVTYDVNVSGLRDASNGKGGIEISLRFVNPNPFKGRTDSNVRFL